MSDNHRKTVAELLAIADAYDALVEGHRSLCTEVLAFRRQAELDRQSREASRVEFARLNRELNGLREDQAQLQRAFDSAMQELDAWKARAAEHGESC